VAYRRQFSRIYSTAKENTVKITKRRLKRIIKEEKAKVLAEQKVRRIVRRKLMEQPLPDLRVAEANSTAQQLGLAGPGSGSSAQKVADAAGLNLAYFSIDISTDGTPGIFVSMHSPSGRSEKFAVVPDGVDPQSFPYLQRVKIHPDFSAVQSADAVIMMEDLSGDDEAYISTSEAIALADQLIQDEAAAIGVDSRGYR
jgi:hypothetical protein